MLPVNVNILIFCCLWNIWFYACSYPECSFIFDCEWLPGSLPFSLFRKASVSALPISSSTHTWTTKLGKKNEELYYQTNSSCRLQHKLVKEPRISFLFLQTKLPFITLALICLTRNYLVQIKILNTFFKVAKLGQFIEIKFCEDFNQSFRKHCICFILDCCGKFSSKTIFGLMSMYLN